MIAGGALYFAALFGLGFLLGPVRELVLAPRIGPTGAAAVEAVPMLAGMLVLAPWAARVGGVPARVAPRLGMGALAVILLTAAETLLDLWLRGRVLWAERLATPAGWIGYALMLAFLLMPALRRRA